MNIEKSIEETKNAFEKSFQNSDYYEKQTSDDKHLELLLSLVSPKEKEIIVDLGTGKGYVAFPLAVKNPDCSVIGMDIVTDTLEANTRRAREQRILNLQFISYDGLKFPLDDCSVDTIVSRYALHHFPDLEYSFREMHRVLKQGGKLVISDPTSNHNDKTGFADAYMKMKQDGHIRFYSRSEYDAMLVKAGFRFISEENTTIRFPRTNPKDYEHLLHDHEKEIWEGYQIKKTEKEIWITENVLNLVYCKQTADQLTEALRVVTSSIRDCEKAQLKFAEGVSQHTLLKNRIKALYISKALLLGENVTERYSKEELTESLRPVSSIISKCEKGQAKFTAGTSHHTRFQNIINAMNISKALILEEISKRA